MTLIVIRKFFILFLVVFVIALAVIIWPKFSDRKNEYNLNMKLTSPAFLNNQFIPSKYTCDGNGINPELNISDVPEDAKSLALIMHDPDAPIAGGFTHWVIWNVDPETTVIAENSVPGIAAVQGFTNQNRAGYVGPCPHQGMHHYEFKIYALDAKLNLALSSRKADLERAMEGHILDQTTLTGLYKRG